MTVLSPAPRPEASLPLFASLRTASPAPATAPAPDPKVAGLFHAGSVLTLALDKGRTLDARTLRTVMTDAFDGSDAEGAWAWKDAYEAVEIAQLLFLRKYGRAMAGQAGSPARLLAMLARLAERLPTHSRRSEESQALQQFSTPLALGAIAARAAGWWPLPARGWRPTGRAGASYSATGRPPARWCSAPGYPGRPTPSTAPASRPG